MAKITCPVCNGSGVLEVMNSQGQLQKQDCHRCGGSGEVTAP